MRHSSKSILLIALLVVPTVAWGQGDHQNQFELSRDSYDEPWVCLWHLGVYTLELYVLEPYNASFNGGGGRFVEHVSGFECKIEAFGDVEILGVRYPVPSINAGTGNNYVVGFSVPVPVSSQSFVLAEVDILIGAGSGATKSASKSSAGSPIYCGNYSGRLLISPTFRASVPGMMAYLDADDPDDPLVGASRYGEDPEADVWTEPRPVADSNSSWGSVKAIFR